MTTGSKMSSIEATTDATGVFFLGFVTAAGTTKNVVASANAIFSGAVSVNDIGGMSVANPTEDQLLAYDSVQGHWVNRTYNYITSASVVSLDYITSAVASATYQPIGDYPTSTQVSTMISAAGVAGVTSVGEIGDVSISAITDGDILSWNSAAGQWLNGANSGAGIGAITSASDVSISSATDGQLLQYSSAQSQWINVTLDYLTSNSVSVFVETFDYVTSASISSRIVAGATGITTFASATDVSVSSPTDLQGIMYSSAQGQWINRLLTEADISDLGTYQTAGDYVTSTSISTMISGQIPTSLGAFDVSLSAVTSSQTLTWSSAGAKWHNTTPTVYMTTAAADAAYQPIGDYITSTLASATYQPIGDYPTSTQVSTMISAAVPASLGAFADVSISVITEGNVLTWNSAASQWLNTAPAAGGISTLTSATDTSISAATDGQLLQYSSAQSQWLNVTVDYITSAVASATYQPIGDYITSTVASATYQPVGDYPTSTQVSTMISAAIPVSLGAFDVSLSAIADGEILVWNSAASQWLNGAQSGGGITTITSATDVSLSAATDGQLLQYSSAQSQWLNVTVDYVTSASLASLGYVTNTSLAQNITTSALAVTGSAGFAGNVSLALALGVGGAATFDGAATFNSDVCVSANINLVGTLTPTAITNYATSAATSTMISAAVAEFVTSASVSTRIAAQIPTSLGAFDVSLSAISDGQILQWNSAASQWLNATNSGAGITTIASASDVSVSSPTDGQVLTYNSAAGQWLNGTAAAGGTGGFVEWTILTSTTIGANVSTVDFTNVSVAGATRYKFIFSNLTFDNSTQLAMLFSNDGGSTFDSTGPYMWWVMQEGPTLTNGAYQATIAGTDGVITGVFGIRTSLANTQADFEMTYHVNHVLSSSGVLLIDSASYPTSVTAAGIYNALGHQDGFVLHKTMVSTVNGFRLVVGAGNVTGGTMQIYSGVEVTG